MTLRRLPALHPTPRVPWASQRPQATTPPKTWTEYILKTGVDRVELWIGVASLSAIVALKFYRKNNSWMPPTESSTPGASGDGSAAT